MSATLCMDKTNLGLPLLWFHHSIHSSYYSILMAISTTKGTSSEAATSPFLLSLYIPYPIHMQVKRNPLRMIIKSQSLSWNHPWCPQTMTLGTWHRSDLRGILWGCSLIDTRSEWQRLGNFDISSLTNYKDESTPAPRTPGRGICVL